MHRPPSYPDLKGRTVFITGGGCGIGAALTAAFAAQDAKVAFVDIAERESTALVERVASETGNRPLFIPCDIRKVSELTASIEKTRATFGDVGILINNAANDERHKVEDVTVEFWDDGIAVNLRPMFFAAQAVLPHMKRLGGGAMINFSSTAWKLKTPGLVVYCATKAAVLGLTRGLAREFGPLNIRVNSVSPGWVKTERQTRLWLNPESESNRLKGQCISPWVQPEDIADMVLFLGSDAASKCTAQDFIVDGGWS